MPKPTPDDLVVNAQKAARELFSETSEMTLKEKRKLLWQRKQPASTSSKEDGLETDKGKKNDSESQNPNEYVGSFADNSAKHNKFLKLLGHGRADVGGESCKDTITEKKKSAKKREERSDDESSENDKRKKRSSKETKKHKHKHSRKRSFESNSSDESSDKRHEISDKYVREKRRKTKQYSDKDSSLAEETKRDNVKMNEQLEQQYMQALRRKGTGRSGLGM